MHPTQIQVNTTVLIYTSFRGIYFLEKLFRTPLTILEIIFITPEVITTGAERKKNFHGFIRLNLEK